ncbi:HIG1 domain family member 1A, mitochondrial [Eurosta solidaginis]|uniref:HIG1 domain family member 1A, mitochondrial n=1 Tax=Eurosta solidaginis TaxID=178769 RepID=UPI003530D76B
MSSDSYFKDTRDEDAGSKLSRKAKDSPFMIIGIAGFVAAGLIGAYKYKTRGSMSTSVYLMQLRVIAQSTVVGALTLGLAYTMVNDYLVKDKKPTENPIPKLSN